LPLIAAIVALGTTVGCSVLLGPDATPVPGAAATLTRSINTPIPTPVRTPSISPVGSPSPAREAVSPSPGSSPAPAAQPLTDADVASVQAQFDQIVGSPSLSGIDGLLLDHVSLSTQQGGSIMDSSDAASWLRDHAGPGITVAQVTPGTQDVALQVLTDGWPQNDPIQNGQVTFSLRRYDADGRQDESGGGDWKIDVIEAD
jgi:hypothetical protein